MIKKIFIIEDFEKNIKLYKSIFKIIPNVELIIESNGIKGLEIIKSSNPDLIILDYKLPGINGIEICKELRKIEKFQKIPIIAVSSSPLDKDVERQSFFIDAGFDLVFSKPLKVNEFRKIVMNFLSK